MPVVFDLYRCIDSNRDWHVLRLSARSMNDKFGILLGLKAGIKPHHIEGLTAVETKGLCGRTLGQQERLAGHPPPDI